VKKFDFPLGRALALRRLQREIERGRMEQALGHIRKVDALAAEIRAEGEAAEADVRSSPMDGTQLMALDGFRGYLRRSAAEVERRRLRAESAVNHQRLKLLEAERGVRVLEKLEAKARAVWRAAADREVEELAAEAHLARWKQS
jgi:flagellar export protein FliJ